MDELHHLTVLLPWLSASSNYTNTIQCLSLHQSQCDATLTDILASKQLLYCVILLIRYKHDPFTQFLSYWVHPGINWHCSLMTLAINSSCSVLFLS